MVEIIRIERKRILNARVLLLFLTIVTLFSAYSTYSVLRRYNIPCMERKVTWRENLEHAKENLQGKVINREFLEAMREQEGNSYLDERNLEELVAANYEGKSVQDLSDDEIREFYRKRLSNIRAMLEEGQSICYTWEEIEGFMHNAEKVSEIKFGYAEGWKVLNDDMGIFTAFLLILISVLLLPLFGVDTRGDMKELYRGTKYGKKPLDYARVLTAFLAGFFLYLSGIVVFFAIKMIPFGFGGWNQCIQSNSKMFFSVYPITNLQQFLFNGMIGLAALLFTVSFLIFITVLVEKVMSSAVIFIFFWILLLLFDQMYLWPVNHYFANFMPLRMTSFSHYYIGNEIYRVFGVSMSCMTWSILLTGLNTGILLLLALMIIKEKRKKGMY